MPGSYQVTVSHLWLDPTPPRTVNPIEAMSPIDFVATYRYWVTTSPQQFNSSTTSQIAVIARGYAPQASCAFWKDASTGTVLGLTKPNTLPRDDYSVWAARFDVAGLPAGTYSSSSWATDCHGHALTKVATASYIVDNT